MRTTSATMPRRCYPSLRLRAFRNSLCRLRFTMRRSDAAVAVVFRQSHGAAYKYFRNDALNANNPFLKAAGIERPTLERNVFGGTLGGPIKTERAFFFVSYQGTREPNGASSNSLSSSIFIALGLTDDRSPSRLLPTFRPRLPNGNLATSINPVALALLNTRLPDGQFAIPTPQADGRYSGSAISTYRENQLNTNIDYRINDRNWLAGKFFLSNAPTFLALPNGG